MITLYDLKAKGPIGTWSPNPWKARYVLNYKKLPYRIIYTEFPDIEVVSKEAGIPPYGKKPDGVTPVYTSPAIIDDATGTALSDSYKIADYLDKAYPDTPKVFPTGSEALQAAFYAQFAPTLSALVPFVLPKVPAMLNERSAEYYVRTRAAIFGGKPLDQWELVGEERSEAWGKMKAGFDKLDGWLSKGSGPFFMGDVVTFADFVAAAALQGLKIIFGENSEEWKDITEWNNGRWDRLLKDLEEYAGVDVEN
ncbi:hypothetical protein P691DRAFT_811852 [Macrolepiota fuliginosa MF-IS2]|uniref:GST N-terminal domain-containing protein n=1 Tax=Macrolepiota fuliginosa MF-IS2 TaxID=1400762 RepID=A0A9P5XE93_9AGAR|nr:hypothetical protein P691DRAFT_811852 [Macrolepiota fuliginosa MF-IS2]